MVEWLTVPTWAVYRRRNALNQTNQNQKSYLTWKPYPIGITITVFQFMTSLNIEGSAVVWWLMPRTPDPEVGGRAPLGSNRVVPLSKAHLLPKSTGNTQEAVAPSQHDWKIVYRDVKNQSTNHLNLDQLANLHCVTLRYLVPLPWHSLKVWRKTDGDTSSTWGCGGGLFYCTPGGSNILTSEETTRPSLQLLSVWNGFAWVALTSF